MLPIRDNHQLRTTALVTWTILVLNALIYVWDRNWNPFGSPTAFIDLSLKPFEVTATIGSHPDFLVLAKFLTSMFLHVNIWHLAGNLLILYVFGPSVEQALGAYKYGMVFLLSGLVAAIAHVFVYPNSFSGLMGASGAIGGVIGAYFLLFPAAKIRCWVIVGQVVLPAWILIVAWLFGQLLIAQAGVANWAHVGGAAVGMLMVLASGGREKILSLHPVEDKQD